jgi:hypothetical protein
MGKKCIICNDKAIFAIKGSSEYYCDDCAHENFSDIELLQKIDEQAKIIKNLIKEKTNVNESDNNFDTIKTNE